MSEESVEKRFYRVFFGFDKDNIKYNEVLAGSAAEAAQIVCIGVEDSTLVWVAEFEAVSSFVVNREWTIRPRNEQRTKYYVA